MNAFIKNILGTSQLSKTAKYFHINHIFDVKACVVYKIAHSSDFYYFFCARCFSEYIKLVYKTIKIKYENIDYNFNKP